jgi:hypothetical protein
LRKPRRLVSLVFAAMGFVCGISRAALPDSGMADTEPSAPAFAPPERRPDPPPAAESPRPRPPASQRKSRASTKRPAPPRSAERLPLSGRSPSDG